MQIPATLNFIIKFFQVHQILPDVGIRDHIIFRVGSVDPNNACRLLRRIWTPVNPGSFFYIFASILSEKEAPRQRLTKWRFSFRDPRFIKIIIIEKLEIIDKSSIELEKSTIILIRLFGNNFCSSKLVKSVLFANELLVPLPPVDRHSLMQLVQAQIFIIPVKKDRCNKC